LSFVAVSIIKFRRAKLLQDARFAKINVDDIAWALANIAGAKALFDHDTGLTDGYLHKAETLLELAIEHAQGRHRND
jgi:hypothetical protein